MAPNNVNSIIQNHNCHGCGTCIAACPQQAIELELDNKKGIYKPKILNSCNNCGLCLKICPGENLNIPDLRKKFIHAKHYDKRLGDYNHLLIGASTDKNVRHKSASGGIVTSLLSYLLDIGEIKGVLLVRQKIGGKLCYENEVYLATSIDQLGMAKGSRYTPVPMNAKLRDCFEIEGDFAFIGLPCHIHGLRKWQQYNPKVRDKFKYVLGLFCANTNTYLSVDYFLKRKKIIPESVERIDYRGEGWPGKITVKTKTQTYQFARGTTEINLKNKKILSKAFHFEYMQPRCLVCPDQTALLADISFGDPHEKVLYEREKEGLTWCIVRNEKMMEVLEKARDTGSIFLQEYPYERAVVAQNYVFKENVGKRFVLWKLLGRPVPQYGINSEIQTSFSLSTLLYLPSLIVPRFLGRCVVWVIELLIQIRHIIK